MSRKKKDSKSFTCQIERRLFERLEEFCKLSRMSKTAAVERAIEKYLDKNMDKVRELSKEL